MLDRLLTKGLHALISMIVTLFGLIVTLDLLNVLIGPLDEIIYGVLVAFMGWAMLRLKRLGEQGKI